LSSSEAFLLQISACRGLTHFVNVDTDNSPPGLNRIWNNSILPALPAGPFWKLFLTLLISATPLCIVLYWRTITSFFIFDDLSILRICFVEPGGWENCFKRMANGFWRPELLAVARAIGLTFGYSPLAFHLVAIALDAIAAALAGVFASTIWPDKKFLPLVVAILVCMNVAPWECGAVYQNVGDPMLAITLLLTLLVWQKSLQQRRVLVQTVVWITILAFLAIAAKETGVILGPSLLLWTLLAAGARRGHIILAGTISLADALYAAFSFWILHNTQHSYSSGLDLNPLHLFRQTADYCVSTIIPYLHVMEAPWRPLLVPNGILWVLRFLTIAIIGVTAVVAARLRRPVVPALVGLALLPLLPVALLSGPPSGRYLYVSIIFVSLLVGRLACEKRWWYLTAVFTGLQIWMVLGFYFSPTMITHKTISTNVSRLVSSMRAHQREWPKGSVISILDHPHPGPDPWRWVYAQHLVAIFLPDSDVAISLGPDQTAYKTYRFSNGALVEQ